MSRVFSGGLIYEFTEEPNHYGLVKVLPGNHIQLLPDFHLARKHLVAVPKASPLSTPRHRAKLKQEINPASIPCRDSYLNLYTTRSLPPSLGLEMIRKGVGVRPGSYVVLSEASMKSHLKVYDVNGKLLYLETPKIEVTEKIFDQYDFTSSTYTTQARRNRARNSEDVVSEDGGSEVDESDNIEDDINENEESDESEDDENDSDFEAASFDGCEDCSGSEDGDEDGAEEDEDDARDSDIDSGEEDELEFAQVQNVSTLSHPKSLDRLEQKKARQKPPSKPSPLSKMVEKMNKLVSKIFGS